MSDLICSGCGHVVADDEPWPFACPRAGDGRDHVLARPALARPAPSDAPAGNPFVRYRAWSYPHRVATARGMSDDAYVALVDELDRAVAAVDGKGFAITPYRPLVDAGRQRATGAQVWAKDETGHVAGSHKARHLFGLALWLTVAERTGLVDRAARSRPLAIASCGNAALAAAVVARALDRRLRVFVPPSADDAVVARLRALDAELVVCPRRAGDPPGDPCYHAFRAAVAGGDLPFTCQGSDNGLTLDGGVGLGLELAEQDRALGAGPLDRVVVQVGGGALATAVARGLASAVAGGVLPRPPAVHAVQTEGCFPLVRAWRRVARGLCGDAPVGPAADVAVGGAAAADDARAARWIHASVPREAIDAALVDAATRRPAFMWPWEAEPRSAASGILDDETYDWLAIVRAMLVTGGSPVAAREPDVVAARALAQAAGVPASATGSAGLAGLTTMRELVTADERVAVLLTGVER